MPFRNFTTEWYQRVLTDSQYIEGLTNSLMVAFQYPYSQHFWLFSVHIH